MQASQKEYWAAMRPAVLCTDLDTVRQDKHAIDSALLESGAVVLKGTRVDDASGFRDLIAVFSGRPLMNYAGGTSPRTKFDEGIYNSTEYPADMQLDLHNEMSYLPLFPSHIYFYCEVPPGQQGATTLGDGRAILKALDRQIVEEFARRGGVRYERFLVGDPASPYSWQSAFETTDKASAERLCRAVGAEFDWIGDALQIHQVRASTANHPLTGQEVWFNQAEGFHHSVLGDSLLAEMKAAATRPRLDSCFADGSEFDVQMLAHIRSVKRALTHAHNWERGDILIVVNILTMHGREPFSGPRKIVVAMN